MSTPYYDIIIAGSGGAGLSLAYYLDEEGALNDKRVLMLDRNHNKGNDRTWSFWYKGEPPFRQVLHKTYEKALFTSNSFDAVLPLTPYQYHVLRGIDFYTFTKNKLRLNTHIEWVESDIQSISEANGEVKVRTSMGDFRGGACFNSLYRPEAVPSASVTLQQHFGGWLIETQDDSFDPSVFTIHDFTVEQKGLHRFVYVLPFTSRKALVEYTIFSESLLSPPEYDAALVAYIENKLNIKNYVIVEREFGVIPMTDYDFAPGNGSAIHNIGTNGGAAKASTGYAFARIQKQTKAIARQIKAGNFNGIPAMSSPVYKIMDSVMLRVLRENGGRGHMIFSNLFRKNSPGAIFSFLDEQSSVHQIMNIVLSMPYKGSFARHLFPAMRSAFK